MAVLAVPLRAEFLYVANEDGNSISAYRIDVNGVLKPVVGSPFPSGKWPVSLAVDLPGRFLFTANMYDDTVSAYRIDSNGVLTATTMPARFAQKVLKLRTQTPNIGARVNNKIFLHPIAETAAH